MKGATYGLAREGWPIVLVLAALAGWLAISPWPALAILPGVLLIVLVMQFRDPPRQVPSDPLGVVSPVDGVVVDIDRGDEGVRLMIRIATFSPYLLRSPTEGNVIHSSRDRSGRGLTVRTDEGEEVWLRLAGPRWLPAAAAVGIGERLGQGQRCGLLRGARAAEIWLPVDSVLIVQRGERVRAGESILGRFHRNGSGVERSPD